MRFELKPVGRTLDNLRTQAGYDPEIGTFLKDQEIEDAYRSLKPVLDALHERFISESLQSDAVREIDVSDFFLTYSVRKKNPNSEKELEQIAKRLRSEIGKSFEFTAESWKSCEFGADGKPIFTEKGYKILTESNVLKYIGLHAEDFSSIQSVEDIEKSLKSFDKFFTYFS